MSKLEKMPGHTRLYRRNAVYYHRAAIPTDIADTYPKTEETFSLRTKDYAEALQRVRVAAVEVDRRFAAHRAEVQRHAEWQARTHASELSPKQIKDIEAAYYAHLLDEDEETRLEGFDEFSDDGKGKREWHATRSDTPRKTFEEAQEDAELFDAAARHALARGKSDGFWDDEAEEVLGWSNVDMKLQPGSESWPKVVRALQSAAVKARKSRQLRDEGEVVETPLIVSSRLDTAHDVSMPLLSTAIESWAREGELRWGEKAKQDYKRWAAVFLELCGDRPLSQYSKRDGRKFKETVQALPANWVKKPKLRGLTLSDAAETARAQSMPGMSISNLNKAMRRVSAFWNWAGAQYFDDRAPEPFKGLLIKTNGDPMQERYPFSDEQLQKLFSSPLYTGCRSLRFCSHVGSLIPNDTGRYWLPLLSLFSGARLGEVCNLWPEEVQVKCGIPVMTLRTVEGEKRVKTSASARTIPLHPELIRLGFMSVVEARRASGSKWVFPEMTGETAAKRADKASRFFGQYFTNVGMKSAKTAFHSLRHNFEDACVYGGVTEAMMYRIQGHKFKGMAGRYGSGKVNIEHLYEAIKKVGYQGLDLSHLQPFR